MRRLAIIVPTFNRAASLERTLRALTTAAEGRSRDAAAEASPWRNTEDTPFPAGLATENRPAIIVVDNSSTDATPDVVASFGPAVRYVRERRQGLGFARNTGIEAARGLGAEVVAFADDGVEPAPDWGAAIVHAFDEYPFADCVGGRVLPANAADLPAWLTREHWGPLALQDHGGVALVFDMARPCGLIGANFAFRLEVFEWIGGFSTDLQRVRDGIGSTEDHEMLQRLYDAGGRAVYVPGVVVKARVPAERMTRDYHRRWHRGHGRFTARMRDPLTERTQTGHVLGVPAHLFRGAAGDAVRWLQRRALRDGTRAFEAETRLWFFTGFFEERCTLRR
jgi:glycosyltransferase involved in cell wall biosynthesis